MLPFTFAFTNAYSLTVILKLLPYVALALVNIVATLTVIFKQKILIFFYS